ncbi:hypothetical protein LR48_Vigan08g097400 [Vigna angularis]|uniref:Uncharacterized protein n=2 Tax=Phaseolus angularis TaxID=3914 RepID=A0A0L9V5D0_PHAAN|nr:hypothetical protein LR48_Vigan08g097400 [Vigna angularis]BAT90006.1 hypothetical protein VIGAN_06116500 [Vigna angularis var. angularis]
MAEPSRNMEVEKLISYTDDLVKVLVEPRHLNNLSYCHQQNLSLSLPLPIPTTKTFVPSSKVCANTLFSSTNCMTLFVTSLCQMLQIYY